MAAIKQRIAEVKATAPPGKSLCFSVCLRPILGDTEEKAWEGANEILSRMKMRQPMVKKLFPWYVKQCNDGKS